MTTYSGLRLSVVHLGKVVFNMPVKSALFPSGSPNGGGLKPSSVSFHDLNGDGTPELVLVLWTGGAHCCYLDQIFDFSHRPAHKTEIDFRDSGARVDDGQRPGRSCRAPTTVSTTPSPTTPTRRHRSRSGSTGAGGLVDTTRSFPGLIGTDAAHWWSPVSGDQNVDEGQRRPRHPRRLGGGRVAARRRRVGADQLLQIAADGDLDHGSGSPKGTAYVASLWKFLGAHGYLR